MPGKLLEEQAIINQSRPIGLDDFQNDKLLMNY